jgi:segregation and condensation protein B
MEQPLEQTADGNGRPARTLAEGSQPAQEEPMSNVQEDAFNAPAGAALGGESASAVPNNEIAPGSADGSPSVEAAAADAPPIDAAQEADGEFVASGSASQADADAAGDNSPQSSPVALVEAILFTADSPLPATKIAQIARLGVKDVRSAVGALNERYHEVGSAFRVEEIAGGLQMLTLGRYRDVLDRLHSSRADSRLTQAALETLAVVAYRQPVLRADVESIRGVACGEVLRGLMEKQLIRIAGRAQILGRPLLYGTTRRFLELFGLAGLEDLPKAEELRAPAQKIAEIPPPAEPITPAGDATVPSAPVGDGAEPGATPEAPQKPAHCNGPALGTTSPIAEC